MLSNQVREKVNVYGQQQILRFYDELSEKEKAVFEEELENLDFSLLDVLDKKRNAGQEEDNAAVYEPLEALKLDEIMERYTEFEAVGIEAIKNCKVGAVLLAGGQGTRLGFDKPKGMFNIGETRELYIFECLINNLMDVVNRSGAYIPLFIMTSDKNDKDTRDFFAEHDYFGYDKDFVFFFVQDMAPSVDYNGKLLLEEKYKLSLSPNGNGGWFSSMVRAGLLDKITSMGVEWLNVFAVDNVLQKMADPVFVGATIQSGKPSGSKVVRKAFPEEKVGVMCKENGKPSIVEYYELTEEMKNRKDASGEPAYNYGVILNYLLKVDSLVEILNAQLPVHIVEKKIPYLDENGNAVSPTEPNGYKFEELILDMIHLLDDCLVFEVLRNREFAPVKNKEGVDSIETARTLLKENGVEI
ncbi:MAG: UDPGP type 1 family protein [Lachnospiraceae bacterium]|nr:UDPGP type 1 family protein [Lachnospiraceae bacterium]